MVPCKNSATPRTPTKTFVLQTTGFTTGTIAHNCIKCRSLLSLAVARVLGLTATNCTGVTSGRYLRWLLELTEKSPEPGQVTWGSYLALSGVPADYKPGRAPARTVAVCGVYRQTCWWADRHQSRHEDVFIDRYSQRQTDRQSTRRIFWQTDNMPVHCQIDRH